MEFDITCQLAVEAAAVQQILDTANELVHKLLMTEGAHGIHAQSAPRQAITRLLRR